MKSPQKMTAGEFKAKCLAVLDRVAQTKAIVIVTKHGRPVAQVVPIPPEKEQPSLLGSVKYHGDIVAPLAEAWDVDLSVQSIRHPEDFPLVSKGDSRI